jgi:hypothetical protein
MVRTLPRKAPSGGPPFEALDLPDACGVLGVLGTRSKLLPVE